MTTGKIYLACTTFGDKRRCAVIRSATVPTAASHGDLFTYCIGPFRTMRAARFMEQCGKGNPHCRTVNDAERIAKSYAANYSPRHGFRFSSPAMAPLSFIPTTGNDPEHGFPTA
jgi:hypothetical protein